MIELRKILEKNNVEYYSIFIHIVENVKKIAPNVKVFFPEYTNHAYKHLENVENNVNLLMNEETLENMNEDEIFCLLCAIWLHDIGMIPFENEREYLSKKTDDEKKVFINNVREKHHLRSRAYVQKHKDILKLSDSQSKAIGNICQGHRKTNLNEFKDIELNNTVRVSYLAAILRIADECDITKERESELSLEGIDENTKQEHYKIHGIVQKIIIDHEKNCIKLISSIKDDEEIILLKNRKNKILDELNEVKHFLKKIHIYLDEVCLDITYSPELIRKKILLAIAQEKNIYSFCNEIISEDDIDYEVEYLLTYNFIKDTKTITTNTNKFKEIYKMFFQTSIKEFFYTDYVENMITKNFVNIENNFNVNLSQDELKVRRDLIKISPTAFYLLLFMDELIENTKFNIHSNQNGKIMFDSIIVFGVFNDIHQYSDKINIKNIEKNIIKLNIFNEEYILPGINFYKKLGM